MQNIQTVMVKGTKKAESL